MHPKMPRAFLGTPQSMTANREGSTRYTGVTGREGTPERLTIVELVELVELGRREEMSGYRRKVKGRCAIGRLFEAIGERWNHVDDNRKIRDFEMRKYA